MRSTFFKRAVELLTLVGGLMASGQLQSAEIIPYGGNWKYLLGLTEASAPDPSAWRKSGFDDSKWTAAQAPIGYANPPNSPAEETLVTVIPSTQDSGYASVFFRGQFVVAHPSPGNVFTVNVNIDDGCIVWINGVEAGRFNMPDGDPTFDEWASSAIEPTLSAFTVTNDANGPVVAGTNTIAVQVFNGNSGSSDLFFDLSLESDLDESAPTVLQTDPPQGGTVADLSQIDVVFTENVTGVDASDLLVNATPATGMSVISPREYSFTFPATPEGTVFVRWAASTGIADLAGNAFAGGNWTYSIQDQTPGAQVIISEFLADNDHGIKDDDGERSDWIELLNTGTSAANLSGWFLTDSTNNLTKWRIPGVILDANKYLLIFASGNDRTNINAPLHTNFKLEKAGGFLALVDPQTNIVSSFAPYPPQSSDVSYGRDPVNTTLTGFLGKPTPGAANVVSGTGFAPAVSINVKGGIFTNASVLVTMTTGSGQIRYTTDGSVPTTTSTLYTGPITVNSSLAIKARAFQGNLLPGPVSSETYILVDSTLSKFTSELPLLIFTTVGQQVTSSASPGQPRTFAAVATLDTVNGRSAVTTKPEFIGLSELEGRGQSSAGFPKQPFNLEFQDEYRQDSNVAPFGLPEGSDWVLYPPYTDKPFLQDFLAYELFEKMGHYSVRRRFVEVFLDTNGGRTSYADYQGIYILEEKIKIDKNRVELDQLTPYNTTEPDISGGYIFKKDKDSPGDKNFSTVGGAGFSGQALKYHDPKPREITTPQANWLRNYLVQMEKAMYASNWKTATGTNHYSFYLDVDSFVDFMWIVEYAKQIDGYRLSNYFFKPRGGKVHEGPIWDWNLSFGNADYLDGESTSSWYWQELGENDHIWLRRLMCGDTGVNQANGDPDFNQHITDRWGELRTNVLSSTNVVARVQELAGLLNEASARDFAKWPRLGQYIWPNPPIYSTPTTYAGIIQSMTNWIAGRYKWIDSQFSQAPVFSLPEGRVKAGSLLTITSPSAGTMYYTLNGTDPRLPGGGRSPSALTYSGPVTLSANARVFARKLGTSRNGTGWTAPTIKSFTVALPTLAITEIMYHPEAGPDGTSFSADDYEYLELKNIGSDPVNLLGVSISGGIQFTFPAGTLDAGAYVLVVKNQAAFQSRYGNLPGIAGVYAGNLGNDGDHIVLTGALGEAIADVTFKDGWYPVTDGAGFSLVSRYETTRGDDLNNVASWMPSAHENGSPGQAEGIAAAIPRVVVNEILSHPKPGQPQEIELQNLSPAPADISGWFLTDNLQKPRKFRIPNGTIIQPSGFVVFTSDLFDAPSTALQPFLLSSLGEDVYLFSADVAGNLTGYSHGFSFGAQLENVSVGRYINTAGQELFVAQSQPSFGTVNAGPAAPAVRISEIMYHPVDVFTNGAYWNNTMDEYIEIWNLRTTPALLYDPNHPTNTWKITGGVSFDFPTNSSLAAAGVGVVVNFDPLKDTAQTTAFLKKFAVPASAVLFGPFQGNLNNAGDKVSLMMAGEPVSDDMGGVVIPYVTEDEVDYSDGGLWNGGADGLGFSLTLANTSGAGNDPTKWKAEIPTPGTITQFQSGPVITLQPRSQILLLTNGTSKASFTIQATGTGTLRYQWLFNGQIIPGENGPGLIVGGLQPTNSGQYSVIVSDAYQAVASDAAILTVELDSDADGMGDDWEFAYGLNPYDPSDANLDADNDGFSNLDEYLAGTNPQSQESYLSVSAVGNLNPGMVQFYAAPNRSYSVLFSDSLAPAVWQHLADVPASAKGSEAVVADPTPAEHRYYRIVTPAE